MGILSLPKLNYTYVIPAKAGIHYSSENMDSRLRGNDNFQIGNDIILRDCSYGWF